MREGFYQFQAELERLKQQHLYRRRCVVDGPQSVVMQIDGQSVINFCSNDYLGLANHPEVLAAFKAGVDQYGVGSGSAHLICGHSRAHHQLEQALAEFTGRERALVFSTGYMANLGLISALVGRGDWVFEDRLNHASLLDGGLLSAAKFARYKHNDLDDLAGRMAQVKGKALIVSDGVFSMDGDCVKLAALADLAQQNNAGLLIDDAHGFGVLGAHGAGIVEQLGLTQQQVPILMGTLGKAFGTFGAFVAGSEDLIEFLIQKARTYVFTTAMPAAVAQATLTSLHLLQQEHWRREKLQQLIEQFRAGAAQQGWQLVDSATAIQPIILGDSQQALLASQRLLALGYWVSAIRPPTVPAGTARLRITLSSLHSSAQVAGLLDALYTVLS